jgi:hypothetical protein
MEAKYVPRYRVDIAFNDGTRRVVDFGPFLKQARNPMFTKYRGLRKFQSFHIQDGDLMWGDFEMIFPIMDLYTGNILKGDPAAVAHLVVSDAAILGGPVLEKKARATTVSYKKTSRKKLLRHV